MEFRDQPDSPDPPEESPTEKINLTEEPVQPTEELSIPLEDQAESEPPATEIQPDFLRNLASTELTPGVAAALKRMLDEKNRKETLLSQIKGLMLWETQSEEVRSLFPENYLFALVDWILGSMQPEVIRQAILDQNRKEQEYHKKREKIVHDQQREMSSTKKRHQEALLDCDMKNTPHRKPIVAKSNDEEMHKLTLKQEEELYSFDRKIVVAIDHLLTAQQKKFQDIGIPGMKETTKPEEISQQMVIIDVIARLSGVDVQVL